MMRQPAADAPMASVNPEKKNKRTDCDFFIKESQFLYRIKGETWMETNVKNELNLRILQTEDAALIEELAGDYEVAGTCLFIPHPYPAGTAAAYIQCMKEAESRKQVLIRAMTLGDDDRLIGVISLNLQPHHKRGELVCWIGRKYWGRGCATEAAGRMLEAGFTEAGLSRITGTAFLGHAAPRRVMEKLGMKQEGILRSHIIKDGRSIDLLYYGILSSEYFGWKKAADTRQTARL